MTERPGQSGPAPWEFTILMQPPTPGSPGAFSPPSFSTRPKSEPGRSTPAPTRQPLAQRAPDLDQEQSYNSSLPTLWNGGIALGRTVASPARAVSLVSIWNGTLIALLLAVATITTSVILRGFPSSKDQSSRHPGHTYRTRKARRSRDGRDESRYSRAA